MHQCADKNQSFGCHADLGCHADAPLPAHFRVVTGTGRPRCGLSNRVAQAPLAVQL